MIGRRGRQREIVYVCVYACESFFFQELTLRADSKSRSSHSQYICDGGDAAAPIRPQQRLRRRSAATSRARLTTTDASAPRRRHPWWHSSMAGSGRER